jgi:hypothetical protein
MRVLTFVLIFGLLLSWPVQRAAAQKVDPKPAKKIRADPDRWDFEALEGRFKVLRLAVREGKATLVCAAKVEGIVEDSDFRFSVFDKDKKRLAARRTVRLLKGDAPLEETGAWAGIIKVKAGEEFYVALDGVSDVEHAHYVVVGSDEYPREPGPPPEAPTGFERPELILDGSEYGQLYPTFADINGDGKIDMLVGNWFGRMLVFRNKGTNARPEYAKPQWLDETVPTAKIRDVQG